MGLGRNVNGSFKCILCTQHDQAVCHITNTFVRSMISTFRLLIAVMKLDLEHAFILDSIDVLKNVL